MESPYRAATAVPLGPLVREHRWALTPFLTVLGVVFLAPAALLPFAFREDLATWEPMTWVGLAVGGVGMPIGGAAILVSARRLSRNYVRLHVEGFEYKWTRTEVVVPWTDVVSITSKIEQKITNGIPGPVTHLHKIATRNGPTLSITQGYRDVDALMAEIRKRTFEHRAKTAQQAFEAGAEVSFGPLAIHRDRGLSGSNGKLPWAELQDVAVGEGQLTVRRTAGRGGRSWDREDLANVPNVDVLLAMVERARAAAAG